MSTSDDIVRLRTAEKDAQELVAKAQAEARRIRTETESRVARVGEEAGQAVAVRRERLQAEEQQAAQALVKASAQRLASLSRDVTGKLEARKDAAVRAVIQELVAL